MPRRPAAYRRSILVLIATATASRFATGSPPPIAVDNDFHVGDLALADLDDDGRTDVIGAGYESDQLAWWRQPVTGTWERHVIDEVNGASQLLVVDLNADERVDILVASQADDAVWWYERLADDVDGQPAFTRRLIVADERSDPASITVGDFDGDGTPDVVVGFVQRPAVSVFRNVTGTGHFLGQVEVEVPVIGDGVSAVEAADVNGDGHLDLIAATPWDADTFTNYFWFAGDGAGGFGPQIRIAGGLDLHGAFAMAAADFDGDGRLDLATMSHWEQNNATVNVFFGQDDAGQAWSAAHTIDSEFAGADSTHALRAVDLDADGDPDLVGGSSFYDPGLRIWWNQGSGNFVADDVADGFAARAVGIADMTGDDRLNIVGGSWGFYTGQIRIWTLAAPCGADVSGDGHIDAADLLQVFAAWGAGAEDPADLDGSGVVDLVDVLEVLADWGPC
ncbi:MAG: FG-GAP repeat domain-containing protein [Phycisphaerales bacterium]